MRPQGRRRVARSSTSFKPGNKAAVRHGGKSEPIVLDRARKIERTIAYELNALGIKRPRRLRRLTARLEAVFDLTYAAIEQSGGLVRVENGRPTSDGAGDLFLRAVGQLRQCYQDLGILREPQPAPDDDPYAVALRQKLREVAR